MTTHFHRRTVFSLILMFFLLLGLLTPTAAASAKPQAAACTWGDIICDMQQALQQLADNYVTPLRAWAQLQANKAVYSFVYSLSRNIAGFMWSLSKMLTTVGVGIGILNQWIAVNFFQPMIQMTNGAMKPAVGIFLFVALCVLGVSYLLAAFIRLNVVSLRSVLLWWFAGALFFSIGPSFYLSLRELHQSIGSLFYLSSINALQNQNPFQNLASGDPTASNPIYQMPALCSNFKAYLSGSAGKINGLDVSLAFQKGDGFDVVNGGDKCGGGGALQDLPRAWYSENGFFDATKAPASWLSAIPCPPKPATCDYDGLVAAEVAKMDASVTQSFAGIVREWQAIPLVWFAIVEQLVALCLIIAQGLTFISFSCAILFAFFKRTEPIAWAVIDQWLSLLIQSVVISLIQGMTIALYLAAARSGSPLVSMAVSIVALVMMVILLVSGLKAVWSAFNRLFEAFGQASGGVFLSPGQAGIAVAGAAVGMGGAAVSGGVSLAKGAASLSGSVAGGMHALNSGATWAQAAGVTFGGSKALDGAAYALARLPGTSSGKVSRVAGQYLEGASARRVGEAVLETVPVAGGTLGRLGGATLGAKLLTDHDPAHAETTSEAHGRTTQRQPFLVPATETHLDTLLTGPRWNATGGAPATNTEPLNQAAQALNASADAFRQAAQPTKAPSALGKEAVEGRLNVSGAHNMATAMGRAIDTLQQQNQATGQRGATGERVSAALAGALEMTPVERNGQPLPVIQGRTQRYQLFADQALKAGLSGSEAGQVLREVQQEGALRPATRERLIQSQRSAQGLSQAESVQQAQLLEHTARLVPPSIAAYGWRATPTLSPTTPPDMMPPVMGKGAVVFVPAGSHLPQVSRALNGVNDGTSASDKAQSKTTAPNTAPSSQGIANRDRSAPP